MEFYCDGCEASLTQKSTVYHCLDCSNLDFCESCFARYGAVHNHLMVRRWMWNLVHVLRNTELEVLVCSADAVA